MITPDAIDAYNTRLTANLNNIRTLSPAQGDRVIAQAQQAQELLNNRDLAMFIHQFKFSLADQLSEVIGHSPDDNSRRVALSNQLTGIDSFVTLLKTAVYYGNRVVTQRNEPTHQPKENNP